MSSPAYQTASTTSAAGTDSHYRPGGTADYSGSTTTSGTTSRYGSTESSYPTTSTYTR